jgi:hypothetical protein
MTDFAVSWRCKKPASLPNKLALMGAKPNHQAESNRNN